MKVKSKFDIFTLPFEQNSIYIYIICVCNIYIYILASSIGASTFTHNLVKSSTLLLAYSNLLCPLLSFLPSLMPFYFGPDSNMSQLALGTYHRHQLALGVIDL